MQQCWNAHQEYDGIRNYLEHLPLLVDNPAVAELAHMFPSLRDAPHLQPFPEIEFAEWMDNEASLQAKHAAHFVLCVWENVPQTFDLAAAFRDWDAEHQEERRVNGGCLTGPSLRDAPGFKWLRGQ